MIRIRSIGLGEIQEFINSEAYKLLDNIPVSLHRVASYLHNPNATENDLVLFLAYENEQLVGYRTVLPDKLLDGQRIIPFAWLSGCWVLPEKRRQGIATLLLNQVLVAWDYRLMFTNYAPESKEVYDKTGEFEKYVSLVGIRAYLRFPFSDVLPSKNKLFCNLKPMLKVTDYFLNAFGDIRFSNLKKNPVSEQFEIEEITELDEESIIFLKGFGKESLAYDIIEKLKWIAEWPWVLEADKAEELDKKYFFSSTSPRYKNIQLKIYLPDRKLVGYLMLLVIGNKLTVPYCFYSDGATGLIHDIISAHMKQFKLNYVTVYHPELVELIQQQNKGYLYIKSIVRNIFCSIGLKNNLPEPEDINWQDGIGDTAFT